MSLGESMFQSSEVSGAVCSGDFEFDRRASGVSFWVASFELLLLFDERVMLLVEFPPAEPAPAFGGIDQSRRWSPEVASRSVDDFC